MRDNGSKTDSALRTQLARVDRSREQIAKAWLVEVILNSDLSSVDQAPVAWATGELPQLISDILMAVSSDEQGIDGAVQRAARLAHRRGTSTSPAQLTREIFYLHSSLLATLRMEFSRSEPELFAEAAERLAAVFTRIGGYTVDALMQQQAIDDPTAIKNGEQMKHRLRQMVALHRRYGSPFAVLLVDVEGPGAQNGTDAMGFVSNAIRGSIRVMDEAFQTEADGLLVLGEEAELLLHAADTAMWRARATGQPFTVAGLQDR
jgi:hypothetical protein